MHSLFLPYYRRGNLQDAIAAHAVRPAGTSSFGAPSQSRAQVNGTHFAEADMLSLFLGTCEAVRAMHTYIAGPNATYPPSSASDAKPSASTSRAKAPPRDADSGSYAVDEDDEDDEGARLAPVDSDSQSQPLIGSFGHRGGDGVEEDAGPSHFAGLGDEEGAHIEGRLDPEPKRVGKAKSGQAQPWAHRDLKPGAREHACWLYRANSESAARTANVMLSDDGKQPILMDFGSALPARIPVPNRQVALTEQDRAAEHSSMPYRAPELFDVRATMAVLGASLTWLAQVKTNVELDEKVDIWSLGCTLFAMAFGTSPFEANPQEAGGSLAMAVLNGAWRFPANDKVYSQGLRDLISAMLVVEPSKRPDIHQVRRAFLRPRSTLANDAWHRSSSSRRRRWDVYSSDFVGVFAVTSRLERQPLLLPQLLPHSLPLLLPLAFARAPGPPRLLRRRSRRAFGFRSVVQQRYDALEVVVGSEDDALVARQEALDAVAPAGMVLRRDGPGQRRTRVHLERRCDARQRSGAERRPRGCGGA
jgi:serine/threonine kinase 16